MFEFCIGGKLTALHDFVKASFDSFRNTQNRLEEQGSGKSVQLCCQLRADRERKDEDEELPSTVK